MLIQSQTACPQLLVATFLLLGSMGSLLLGREFASVVRVADPPMSVEDGHPFFGAWWPVAPFLAPGLLGVIPPCAPQGGNPHHAVSTGHSRQTLSGGSAVPVSASYESAGAATQATAADDAARRAKSKHDGAGTSQKGKGDAHYLPASQTAQHGHPQQVAKQASKKAQ